MNTKNIELIHKNLRASRIEVYLEAKRETKELTRRRDALMNIMVEESLTELSLMKVECEIFRLSNEISINKIIIYEFQKDEELKKLREY